MVIILEEGVALPAFSRSRRRIPAERKNSFHSGGNLSSPDASPNVSVSSPNCSVREFSVCASASAA
eukprot:1040936-Prymnesium_polylepis.1